jgi:hypothetical protein
MTTGTTSQRCSAAVSQRSWEGDGMKSESTKTNVPALAARRRSPRYAIERSSQSAGLPNSDDMSRWSWISRSFRSPFGWRQCASPSA